MSTLTTQQRAFGRTMTREQALAVMIERKKLEFEAEKKAKAEDAKANKLSAAAKAKAKAEAVAKRKANVEETRQRLFESTDVRYAGTTALQRAIRESYSPGVWVEYKGEKLNEFLLELPTKVSSYTVPLPDGRTKVVLALESALASMPYIYRTLIENALAEYAGRKLLSMPCPDPVPEIRVAHSSLMGIRDFLGAQLGLSLSDWAEAVHTVEVGKDAEPGHMYGDNAILGDTITGDCTLEERKRIFTDELREAMVTKKPTEAAWAVVKWAGIWAEAKMPNLDGWEPVLADAEFDKTKVREGIWMVNAAYRGIRRQLALLNRLEATSNWELRKIFSRNASGADRPYQEPYAGGDNEVVVVGRKEIEIPPDWTDAQGQHTAEHWMNIQWEMEIERRSLQRLYDVLEPLNREMHKVFRLMGLDGAPVGYIAKRHPGGKITFDVFYDEATYDDARKKAAMAWLAAREDEAVKRFTPQDLAYLESLAANLAEKKEGE